MYREIKQKIDNYRTRRNSQVFWAIVATSILVILLSRSDVGKMAEAFTQANFLLMSASIMLGLISFILWSVNWNNFFTITGIEAGLARTFQLFEASRFLNLVTPLGQFGGQPIMAYLVMEESNASYEEALATLSSADLIVILPVMVYTTIGYAYLSITGTVPSEVTSATKVAAILASIGIFLGYMGWRRPRILKNILFKISSQVKWITGKESKLVKKIDNFLTNLEDSYRAIGKNPKKIFKSFAIVHVSYFCKVMAFFVITVSLGMNISIFHAMLLIPLVSIANFSPTPGGTGAVEAALSGLIVVVTGLSLSVALLATLIYRISTYWLGVVLGYVSLATLSFDADEYTSFMEDRN